MGSILLLISILLGKQLYIIALDKVFIDLLAAIGMSTALAESIGSGLYGLLLVALAGATVLASFHLAWNIASIADTKE